MRKKARKVTIIGGTSVCGYDIYAERSTVKAGLEQTEILVISREGHAGR